jgi:hypothetical protein
VRRSDCPGRVWVTDNAWFWPIRATDVALKYATH